ncbi:hypothetical protein CM49_02740 [Paenibacillus sp. P1XP2]|nr:hypothetical protein CM49_02740 [Paenibacillus sp. P1XP2]
MLAVPFAGRQKFPPPQARPWYNQKKALGKQGAHTPDEGLKSVKLGQDHNLV